MIKVFTKIAKRIKTECVEDHLFSKSKKMICEKDIPESNEEFINRINEYCNNNKKSIKKIKFISTDKFSFYDIDNCQKIVYSGFGIYEIRKKSEIESAIVQFEK